MSVHVRSLMVAIGAAVLMVSACGAGRRRTRLRAAGPCALPAGVRRGVSVDWRGFFLPRGRTVFLGRAERGQMMVLIVGATGQLGGCVAQRLTESRDVSIAGQDPPDRVRCGDDRVDADHGRRQAFDRALCVRPQAPVGRGSDSSSHTDERKEQWCLDALASDG